MGAESLWFFWQAAMSAAALLAGIRLGSGPSRPAGLGAGGSLGLLGLWVWLLRHPSVAVHVIPLRILTHVEGTGAAPFFMFVMGVLWKRSSLPRQRRVTVIAIWLGVVYFFQGGFWMLQTTPRSLLAETISGEIMLQSEDYTCVPAACATALVQLGVGATEAELAQLTRTRAGFGSTLIRAMDGLNRKLKGTGIRVVLVEPSYDELLGYPMPALTPLHLETTRRHMVVLQQVTDSSVSVIDPQLGKIRIPRDQFEQSYCRQVLAFDR